MSMVFELVKQLQTLATEDNETPLRTWQTEARKTFADLCLPEIDMFINGILNVANSNVSNSALNEIVVWASGELSSHAKLIRFFRAMFPGDESVSEYIHMYHNIITNLENGDCISYCNAMLARFGMAAVPDILLASNKHRNTKLYNAVAQQMDSIWTCTAPYFGGLRESIDEDLFQKLTIGHLKDAFESYVVTPRFLAESKIDIHFDKKIEHDVQMILEHYEDDEEKLGSVLQSYNEKQLDITAANNAFLHILHDGALSMESYMNCCDMFESIGDLCDRDDKYLALAENSYRVTGKIPRYISNTYDFKSEQPEDKKDEKKSEDWINEPKDEDFKKDDRKDKYDEPDPKLGDEKDSKKDEKKDDGAKTIYNITYQNSFNRNRKHSINDSFNNSRLNSDDIDNSVRGGLDSDDLNGRNYNGKQNVMAAWQQRNKIQKKLQETYGKKKPLSEPPQDVSAKYLNYLLWDSENLRKVDPWVVMRDTHKNRPAQDLEFRKYLVRKMEALADDRDIEFDGNLVVAGDATDGIYDIELTRYNDVAIVDALRKVANAVIKQELKHLSQKPKTNIKTINETLEYFNQIDLMEEEILGGDPEKDRPFVQRVQNKVSDFNSKAQVGVNKFDQTMRGTSNIVRGAVQTPVQLVNTVKNFISDMKNRKEQNIKEDILHNKKLRLSIFDMMRSLLKTALPWMVLGPLWGTLFNMVALPIRGVKGAWVALRGGQHRDLYIEMRDELRAEMDIIQDKVNKATNDNEKHQLMRQYNRMQQDYYKIAANVHFDPNLEKRQRIGY